MFDHSHLCSALISECRYLFEPFEVAHLPITPTEKGINMQIFWQMKETSLVIVLFCILLLLLCILLQLFSDVWDVSYP